jgi:hypothetical protein
MGEDSLQTQALEHLVSQKLGHAVRQISCEELVQKKAPQRLRRYFKYVLVGADGHPVHIFTKTGMPPAAHYTPLETFLSSIDFPEFRAPKFYGVLDLAGGRREGRVGVWECLSGHGIDIEDYTTEHYRRVTCAVARINALTDEVLRHVPDIRVGLRRVGPVHDAVLVALQDFSERGADVAELMPLADRLARLEERALARLAALGNCMFSHMDISPPNLIFEPQTLAIIDWDSSCIGPPGCSLRILGLLPNDQQNEFFDYYVRCMAGHGISVRAADIGFTIRALQVLSTLGWGARRSAPGRLARPLEEDEDLRQGLNEKAELWVRWGLQHIHYLE